MKGYVETSRKGRKSPFFGNSGSRSPTFAGMTTVKHDSLASPLRRKPVSGVTGHDLQRKHTGTSNNRFFEAPTPNTFPTIME